MRFAITKITLTLQKTIALKMAVRNFFQDALRPLIEFLEGRKGFVIRTHAVAPW